MDCSICFDAITKKTGSVSLSCEHIFHFRCIDEWFTKQILEEQEQTCPCCRSKGTDLDRCNAEVVQENEEDDDETFIYEGEEEESETASIMTDDSSYSDVRFWQRQGPGTWLIISSSTVAYESMRALFGPLNELELENPEPVQENPQEQAARKIQAFFRGKQYQNNHEAALALMRLFQQAYNL
jgi:hypothetical protein